MSNMKNKGLISKISEGLKARTKSERHTAFDLAVSTAWNKKQGINTRLQAAAELAKRGVTLQINDAPGSVPVARV